MTSAYECEDACTVVDDCSAWTFYEDTGICYYKNDAMSYR